MVRNAQRPGRIGESARAAIPLARNALRDLVLEDE